MSEPFENISSIRNTGPQGGDILGDVELNQNIKLQENMQAPQQNQSEVLSTGLDAELSTLDEPVSETIKRDLQRIYNKLKIVVNPF